MHITLRIRTGLPSLRTPALFRVVRAALAAGKARDGFGLVHFSVQSNHLHLIVEAESRPSLSRGMQGLCVRIARAVNRQVGCQGRLFEDRYHDRSLRSPRAVQLALRYVLLNARKHQASPRQRHERANRPRQASREQCGVKSTCVPTGFVDVCSSAPWFDGFARPDALAFGKRQTRAEWAARTGTPAPVVSAHSWLLRVGYQRAGPFDCDDAPAERRATRN